MPVSLPKKRPSIGRNKKAFGKNAGAAIPLRPLFRSTIFEVMKKDIHPKNYRIVVFKDISTDEAFLGRSCVNTKETIVWEDGQEYPLVKMEISAYSHPFFTGKMKYVDTAGRIDKFNKKFANTKFAK